MWGVYFLDKDVGWVCGWQYVGSIPTGVILSTNDGGENWTKLQIEVGSSYHSYYYNEVYFQNINTGILAGSGGILRTKDGGQSWEIKHNVDINGMSFYDANNAIAVGSIILKTTDGGDTWIEQFSPRSFSNVAYINNTTAFGVANGSRIYRTTDGGNDWEMLENPGEDDLFGVHFFDENFGTAVGDGTVMRTNDGGETWVHRYFDIHDLIGVYHISATDITAIGNNGSILHTTDGGLNWEYEASGTTAFLFGVHFIGANFGVVVGKDGTILMTESLTPEEMLLNIIDEIDELVNVGVLNKGQGNSFISKLQNAIISINKGNIKAAINKIEAFINQVNAYINAEILTEEQAQSLITAAEEVVTKLMLLEKTSQRLISTKSNILNDYILDQNHPNPFNPSTLINYHIPESGFVTLKVYDVLGNEVATLLAENKESGRYSLTFDASSLSSGVYIYQLRVNDYLSTKKMVLMK